MEQYLNKEGFQYYDSKISKSLGDINTDIENLESTTENLQSLINQLSTGSPIELAVVATTGDYNDLINSPTSLPASDVYSWAKLQNKPTYTKSEIGLNNVTNDALVKRSEMGIAKGVATLDSGGKVPSSQLPSYVDDVIEGTLTTFPTSGETGKIYVDTNTNKTYRFSGTTYVEISPSIGVTVTNGTQDLNWGEDIIVGTVDGVNITATLPTKPTKSDIGLGNVDNKSTNTLKSEIMTTANVKSALGTGTGTTKFLREDGTWQIPTYTTNTDRYVNSAKFESQGTNGASGQKMTLTRAGSDTATITATIPVATTTSAGVMSGELVTKLNGVATGATNVTESTVSSWGFTKNAGTLTSHQTVTLASGTNNGTLKITTAAGTTDNIAVKGLGSLAYSSATIPTNTNQLTNGAGFVTSSGVTSVATGVGLAGGTITGTGTIKANLASESAAWTRAANYTEGGNNKLYAIGVDSAGKLAVYVPWTDSNTWVAANSSQAGYVPAATKGKFLHSNASTGNLEWVDDNNTTYTSVSQFTNDSGYITGITKNMVTDALGYTPPTSDTKNTTGTSNKTETKLFIAGAASLTDGVLTFSNSNCYIGTDNCLYSGGAKVLTSGSAVTSVVNQTGAVTAAQIGTALTNAGYKLTDTTPSAGTGLSLSGTTLNHSNSVTAQTTLALYPIKIDALGHISSYGSAVTSLPASDVYSWAKASSKPSYIMSEVATISVVATGYSNTAATCSILGSANAGKSLTIIYTNSSTNARTVTITPVTTGNKILTPTGQVVTLSCPAGGYCEVNFLNISGIVYARGL